MWYCFHLDRFVHYSYDYVWPFVTWRNMNCHVPSGRGEELEQHHDAWAAHFKNHQQSFEVMWSVSFEFEDFECEHSQMCQMMSNDVKSCFVLKIWVFKPQLRSLQFVVCPHCRFYITSGLLFRPANQEELAKHARHQMTAKEKRQQQAMLIDTRIAGCKRIIETCPCGKKPSEDMRTQDKLSFLWFIRLIGLSLKIFDIRGRPVGRRRSKGSFTKSLSLLVAVCHPRALPWQSRRGRMVDRSFSNSCVTYLKTRRDTSSVLQPTSTWPFSATWYFDIIWCLRWCKAEPFP